MRSFLMTCAGSVLLPLSLNAKTLCEEFCTRNFTLDETAARCILETFEDRLARLERSRRDLVRIDISETCLTPGAAGGDRDPVGKIPDAVEITEIHMDRAWLTCLAKHVRGAEPGSFDPGVAVEMGALCQ